MKSKSCIVALLAVFTLGMTTSCEDMFDIESNRVVYDHELNSTADSAFTTLGVLTCMRDIAERYVILGEVRGDMVDVNDNTTASLRNLANFNFESDAENEYLDIRDYYTIINNCNYALDKMDVNLALNNKPVMMDEYVALLGIRAWTYLQLAINYDSVYYYTYPVTSESDVQRARAEGKKDVQTVVADLALQLVDYLDYELPSFAGTSKEYPLLRLVLADLYLWGRNYEGAVNCYENFFMKNKKNSFSIGTASAPYMNLGGYFQEWKEPETKIVLPLDVVEKNGSSEEYSNMVGIENLSYVPGGSNLSSLFYSSDNTHELNPSASWHTLSSKQMVFKFVEGKDGKKDSLYRTPVLGDMRKYRYYIDLPHEGERFGTYNKLGYSVVNYRRTLACLRWAESLNALARTQYDADDKSSEARVNAVNAFYLLKDASKVFFPDSSAVMKQFAAAANKESEWRTPFVGIHARGCGDVRYDTTYYVLKPAVIANSLGRSVDQLSLIDTVEYIDNLIIDELALESTLEGNRFGDLIRFAKRREAWGDSQYRDFLAKRVSERGGEEVPAEERQVLYEKLSASEKYWYLPFK